ncbi:hypothetical protein PIB30_061955 [Stylosanthes scabra]|uniref:Uncharacterized protein n=1 Tax=Stylosanthes scabra TaxID=79078 RepID=A0ABU6YNI8_9FABA|nr:hypothetical protein [Stylosanthes scabra]
MARKIVVHHRLRCATSPSSVPEPSPSPSSCGPRRRVVSPEPEPSSPRSSRGKRPLEEEEDTPPSPPAQPCRHRSGGIKKTKGRNTKEQPSFAAPHSSKGPSFSTNKKIKKLVKIVKELMGEVTGLVNMLMTFSKNRHTQEASDQRDLTKTKKLMEMAAEDIQDLEEDIYNFEVEAEAEAEDNEEEDTEDSDA